MIHRIDVRAAESARDGRAAADPVGEGVRRQIVELGFDAGEVSADRVYFLDTDADAAQVRDAADALLADPVIESAAVVDDDGGDGETGRLIEIHLKPGVMDPVAASTAAAVRDLGLAVREVRTGRAYRFAKPLGRAAMEEISRRALANGVVESVHFRPHRPTSFTAPPRRPFELRHVELTTLDEAGLKKLSRDGHLFLSPEEMRAVQAHFAAAGREPTDVELETVAQTWSEHCVHKTLKSAVEVVDETGAVVRRYGNLIKETIFAATEALMARGMGVWPMSRPKGVPPLPGSTQIAEQGQDALGTDHGRDAHATGPFCLSVFSDNAGVVAFDEIDAVCFKVETHNHPSAIEPYGGAATGIGGCIRDVLGTGLGAKPVANTDVFCVAFPEVRSAKAEVRSGKADPASLPTSHFQPPTSNFQLPTSAIHPKRALQQIVAGVRDYGNRMGIPTVNGAVYFDENYVGNPLVFCGCAGLIPRDKIDKRVNAGDAVVVMGGRTGRDGIHGATFSSAELTDTHADEFSHAVQIGNAITEKQVADVLLAARDRELFTAVTDCGAGGLSSAVGEMGERVGASVQLEKVPLKYAGLRYDEIWISEAQERMVLSVPPERVEDLLALAASEGVEATAIGTFGTPGRELILTYDGTEVARLPMAFLHDGLPMPTRKAVCGSTGFQPVFAPAEGAPSAEHGLKTRATAELLLKTLAHPNVASKHWVIRQYDHEVQGGSVVKPLVGPLQIGPSDAAVVRPKLDSMRAIALSCGLAPHVDDPYDMAVASIDEAVRNAVCVGATLDAMALLDNFCWPSVDDPDTMGTLVRACEACRDAALAFGLPFISGKDSLHNQFTDAATGRVIKIPRTLLISAMAVLDDARRCVTMDLKTAGNALLRVEPPAGAGLADLAALHRAVSAAVTSGRVRSCHDVSDGGPLAAVAEMCIASGLGAALDRPLDADPVAAPLGTYLMEVAPADADGVLGELGGLACIIGTVAADPRLTWPGGECSVTEMTAAWRGTLDW